MNLLMDHPRKLFFRYLFPAISSTLVTSIYILVDTMIVGRGVGADALVALNLMLPLFAVFFAIGLLFGVGGGVLFSNANGSGDKELANQYFTVALLGVSVVSGICSLLASVFFKELAYFLGSNNQNIGLVTEYATIVVRCGWIFSFSTFLQTFVRNDKAPKRAMVAVLSGAAFNIVLDYLFVFGFKMEMFGASLATVLGNGITVGILLTHFFSKQNTIQLTKSRLSWRLLWAVMVCGVASFLVDVASGIVTFFFNHQILRYVGENGIIVYGVITNYLLVALSLYNGVSQAAQPIMAMNFGARNMKRIYKVRKYGLLTTSGVAFLLFGLGFLFPEGLIYLFVKPTKEVLELGHGAIRIYLLAILMMGFNIFFSNYFQTIEQARKAFALCLLRGIVFSIGMVFFLPFFFGRTAIWWAIPAAEALTLGSALWMLRKIGRLEKVL